jgi:hypothetical protein
VVGERSRVIEQGFAARGRGSEPHHHLHSRAGLETVDGAFDRIVDDYNRIVTRLCARLDELHREVCSEDAKAFIELVRANVRGNLDAMQA